MSSRYAIIDVDAFTFRLPPYPQLAPLYNVAIGDTAPVWIADANNSPITQWHTTPD